MNTRIGDTSGVTNNLGSYGVGETTKTEEKTGVGVSGANGEVPNPVALGFGTLLQALRNFAPAEGKGDFEVKLAEITAKMREVSGDVATDRVLNDQESKRLNMKENQAKIEESEKKLEEAEAKRKSGNIFDKIAMAFQALGALLMVALGALLSAVPGMQVVGGLMIATGVLMAISLVNSIVASANEGAGILGSIAKAAGADPDVIMGLDIAFMASLMIATIVMGIATGNVAKAATAPAEVAAMVAAIKTASTAANLVTNTGSAVSTAAGSGIKMSAAQSSSEASNLRAESDEIQALMQQLDDMIDQALEMLKQSGERFNAIADSMTEMLNETGQTLSSTRFSG